MTELQQLFIGGMTWSGSLLWVAAPEERLVAAYDPATGRVEEKVVYTHAVWGACPGGDGLWMMAEGGKLGRQMVLWSEREEKEIRRFNCPDGAGAGFTLCDGKLWVTHRHKRKLICLDPEDGKVRWTIRTEHESFSPSAFGSDLWFIESDLGPLGHWGRKGQGRYFFTRYDPAREKIVERLPVSFVPTCMTFDGERFWYAERDRKGFLSTEKNLG
jgi:streptogramin lyase